MRPFSTGGPDRRMSLRLLFCYLRLAANCSNCAAAVPAGKAWIRTSKTRSNPPGEVAEVPCTGGIRRKYWQAFVGIDSCRAKPQCGQVSTDSRRAAFMVFAGRCLHHQWPRRSRRALKITDAELRLIANAAIKGDRSHPVNGYSTPAAIGTPMPL